MFDYIKHNKYREINSSIPGTTVQIRLQCQPEESNMEPESLSLEEDGKNSSNKKRIAYRARKTHKLRECQTRRTRRYSEDASSGTESKKWQLQNADTDTQLFASEAASSNGTVAQWTQRCCPVWRTVCQRCLLHATFGYNVPFWIWHKRVC